MEQTSKQAKTWRLGESLSDKIVGRFLICERLGTGGMGEVYRAEDTILKRSVAVKRMAPILRADPRFRERFFKEAQRVSRFSDPHVAAIYDVLEDNSEVFLVMEYVEGQTLRERLCQPLQLDKILDIAEQCAEALTVAHSHGVVHCDIKPENIMLTPTGHVKVLDFGVAKLLPRSNQNTTIDKSRTLSGTPGYMAPEVLLEDTPDERADIFSLGVVVYEALTGCQPFRASSFVVTCEKVLREIPPPVTVLNPELPLEFNVVIGKMLAKNPRDRFQSAEELVTELRRLQARTKLKAATSDRQPTSHEEIARIPGPFQGRRIAVLFLVTLVVALIAILGRGAYHRGHSAAFPSTRGALLISDFDTTGPPIPEAGLREGLTIALQQSRYVNVYPRSRVYEVLERMKRKNVERIDEALGREICQRENVRVLLVGSVAQIGETFQITVRALDPAQGNVLFAEKTTFDRKEEFFASVDLLARRVREDLGESAPAIENSSRPLAKVTTRSLSALQLYSQATDAFGQGRVGQVPALLQGALAQDPEFAMARRLMAQIHEMMGNRAAEQEELKRAYDLRQSVTERERRLIEASYYNLIGDDTNAINALIAIVTLYPDDPDAHALLASEYYDLGDLGNAIQQLRQLIKIDPGSASAYGKLVTWLARNNAPDQAIQVYQEAASRGLDSSNARWGLGMALWNEGKVAEAEAEFRRLQAANPPYDSIGRIYFARVLIYKGRLLEASEQLASGIREDQVAKNKSPELLGRYLLARTAMDRGDRAAALRQLMLIMRTGEPKAFQATDLERTGAMYAQIGEVRFAIRALKNLEELQSRNATAFNKASFHLLAGEIELARGKPVTAAKYFSTSRTEYPFPLAYGGLARAYERRHDWQRAAAAWQGQLRARGEIFQDEYPTEWVLAHLALARVYVHLDKVAAALTEYETFLKIWENGEDLPALREARHELRKLTAAQNFSR